MYFVCLTFTYVIETNGSGGSDSLILSFFCDEKRRPLSNSGTQ